MSKKPFKMEVAGMKELNEQLIGLGAKLGNKTLRAATKRAFMPIIEEAKAIVQVRSGDLWESIQLSAKTPKKGDAVTVVGLKIGKAGTTRPEVRWHLTEFGTAHSEAFPFIRPAFDMHWKGTLDTLRTELGKAIQRAVMRQKNKARKAERIEATLAGLKTSVAGGDE